MIDAWKRLFLKDKGISEKLNSAKQKGKIQTNNIFAFLFSFCTKVSEKEFDFKSMISSSTEAFT